MKRSTSRSVTVSERHRVQLVDDLGQSADLEARFGYDPTDPYAMSITFLAAEPVTWVFARELLLSGMYEPTGDGDVHVWPCLSTGGEAVVIFELSSPDGAVMVQVPVREMTRFTQKMIDSVAPGTEHALIDLDAAIGMLLSADPDHSV